uniref:Ab2-073 n=1 Tax=Rattus norvegicus TaxID=10116 RepID=Q7TP62_RAT|nr:Ab2-073 [Rattus norvegicus]|eukprot:NP_001041385.1 uncharacterized protein LOC367195 [Rattus norvegicus]
MEAVPEKEKKVAAAPGTLKKKKVPAESDTLEKKRRNFAELKVKCLRKTLRKATRKLICEKAKHSHKECRQMYRTEIRMARTARRAGNVYACRTSLGLCHQTPRYQWSEPKGAQGAAAASSSADPPWHLCEAQQGFS